MTKWAILHHHESYLFLPLKPPVASIRDLKVSSWSVSTNCLPCHSEAKHKGSVVLDNYPAVFKNREKARQEIVGKDIEDFEYTPKPEYEGFFRVVNVENEVKFISIFKNNNLLIFF